MRKFRGKNTNRIFIEVFSDEKGSLLEDTFGGRAFWTNSSISCLTEIKEPVKITVWKNVWRRKDGSIFFGCDWPDKESADRDVSYLDENVNTFVETISFTYTEQPKG